MQLNKFNIRDFYRRNNKSINTKNNILFENALSSIYTTSRLSRPLVEDYFNNCINYENANRYNDNLITLLEYVVEENNSLYNKLEGIYINNIIPRLENANIRGTINLLKNSKLKNSKIIKELNDYLVCDRIIDNYKK